MPTTHSKQLDYNFALVVFTQEIQNDKKIIDFVPSNWLQLKEDGSFMTQYMQPEADGSYQEEDLKLLNALIKNRSPPPEGWPLYEIEIKGGSGRNIFLLPNTDLKAINQV